VTKTNSCDKVLSVLLITRCHTGGKRAKRPEKRSQFLHWNGRTPARLGSMCRYQVISGHFPDRRRPDRSGLDTSHNTGQLGGSHSAATVVNAGLRTIRCRANRVQGEEVAALRFSTPGSGEMLISTSAVSRDSRVGVDRMALPAHQARAARNRPPVSPVTFLMIPSGPKAEERVGFQSPMLSPLGGPQSPTED
jgi:hypothetical protein